MRRLGLFWAVSGVSILGSAGLLLQTPTAAIAASSGQSCIVSSIHDADTLRADCNGTDTRVRFYCIDAPELAQKPWGQASRDALRARVSKGDTVQVQTVDTDRYGRVVGKVSHDGTELNLWLVQQGRVAVYPAYCKDQRYFDAQAQAKRARLGIWAAPGQHQTPWNYRKEQK